LLNNACKKTFFVYFYHLIGFLYTFIWTWLRVCLPSFFAFVHFHCSETFFKRSYKHIN
jgi:hypothetical protein